MLNVNAKFYRLPTRDIKDLAHFVLIHIEKDQREIRLILLVLGEEIFNYRMSRPKKSLKGSKYNLTKVRTLVTLSHRGSDNSTLHIVFSANYIDHSDRDFGISETLTF